MRITLKTIAGFQILTGLIMSVNILFFLAELNTIGTTVIKNALFLTLYLGVAFAGVLLWKNKPIGLTLSILAQSLHLISFDILKLAYRFTGLIDFFVYFRSGEGIGFNGYFGGRYAFTIFEEAAASMFGVNVVAIILLVILVRAKKDVSIAEMYDA